MYNFFMPNISLMLKGCLSKLGEHITRSGFKKALIVTDKVLTDIGLVDNLKNLLNDININYVVFNETNLNNIFHNNDSDI